MKRRTGDGISPVFGCVVMNDMQSISGSMKLPCLRFGIWLFVLGDFFSIIDARAFESNEVVAVCGVAGEFTWPSMATAKGYKVSGVLRVAEGQLLERIDRYVSEPGLKLRIVPMERWQVLQISIRPILASGAETAAVIHRRYVIQRDCE